MVCNCTLSVPPQGSFRVYGAKASRQVFLFERGILISKKKEAGMLTCKAFVPVSTRCMYPVTKLFG